MASTINQDFDRFSRLMRRPDSIVQHGVILALPSHAGIGDLGDSDAFPLSILGGRPRLFTLSQAYTGHNA